MQKRRWTYTERKYLQENWGNIPIKKLAKILGRTVSAVKEKAYKLGLRRFIHNGEYITLNQLFHLFGKDSSKYTTKIFKANFPVKHQKIINQNVKVVYMEDFWRWFKKNIHLIDLSKTETYSFGYEPAWVKEKRQADKRAAEYKTTKWTKAEDNNLISLLKSYRYNYREISIRLKRTEGAIKRRMLYLKLKERPLRESPHPWTKREIEIVKSMYLRGYKSCIIAEYVERSAIAINGLLERNNYFKKQGEKC